MSRLVQVGAATPDLDGKKIKAPLPAEPDSTREHPRHIIAAQELRAHAIASTQTSGTMAAWPCSELN